MASRIRRIQVIGASVGLALLVAECGLRLLGKFEPPHSPPIPRVPGFYRPDPELGYTLWPSRQTTYHYPPRSARELTLVSNSDGFRSAREFDEPDERTRIWVLGDSMVLGDGVEAEHRLTEIVERHEPGWRVENLGMTGWGIDLMIRAFEQISRRVSPIEPEVVLLAFYTDDFRRLTPFHSAQGYAFPKFELSAGGLVSVPFPSVPAWRRLRVVQAIEQSYWRPRRNRYDLHQALLDRLHDDARSLGASLAVVFLPGRDDTAEDRERRAWLHDWCARAGVPFTDLTETIHRVGEDAFIPGNPHWNEEGHRLAGDAIHEFLRDVVLER